MPASDIAIVGAGPAGAWAAYRLAQRGANVHLFDASHPREKPCGGGVSRRALDLIADAIEGCALSAVAIGSAWFETDAAGIEVPLSSVHGVSSDPSLIVVPRARLDAALVEAAVRAGAKLVPTRVVDVRVGTREVTIETPDATYRADWLIGADGANSLVRRRLARPFVRAQLSIATGFFAHGLTAQQIIVRFQSSPPGYFWSFPRADHLAIGACAQADTARAAVLRAQVRGWLQHSGVAESARLEPYTWPIPSLSAADWEREAPGGPRWLLVGDAAGLVDPITREGIPHALHSAELATEALVGARSPDRDYLERLYATIVVELRQAARLKPGFFRTRFLSHLIHALDHSRAVRRVMADLVTGAQPYATLKRRLLGTFEVGLAWRLLMLQLGAERHQRPARAPATGNSKADVTSPNIPVGPSR